MSKVKKYRYIGDISLGERAPFVPGVPGRDLYEDDDADVLKIAEANSQTPGAVFVAVKHRDEPAAEPVKAKAKEE